MNEKNTPKAKKERPLSDSEMGSEVMEMTRKGKYPKKSEVAKKLPRL